MKLIRLLVLLIAFISASLAHAQSTVGVIAGYVTDPSNSAVTDAKVTVTDEKTGKQRQATTNETGGFTVVQLPPSTTHHPYLAARLCDSPGQGHRAPGRPGD